MSETEIDARPGLAIVTNSVTPYHVNLQRLIADGIPEFKLHVLITHWASEFQWNVPIPPQIELVRFGKPGESPLENPLRRPLWGWRKGGRMMEYFREHNIRVAIINGYRFISYLRLMNFCAYSDIPFFVNQDSNIRGDPQHSWIQRFVKVRLYDWWLKRASGVFSMGALGDAFFQKYGADSNRLYRVPYWPDYDSFSECDEVRLQQFRQRFGLHGSRRYILFSGRLVQVKRVDLLLDAFAAIAADRPDWDLLIVGDGILRDELRQRISKELALRIIWAGFLESSELVTAYNAADVLALPSDHEPWAVVVQEAMAAGNVVVASDVVGAAHELVTNNRSGRIFTKGNVKELTRALLDVTDKDALPKYKEESISALAHYRLVLNPVTEVRRALVDVGKLNSNLLS